MSSKEGWWVIHKTGRAYWKPTFNGSRNDRRLLEKLWQENPANFNPPTTGDAK